MLDSLRINLKERGVEVRIPRPLPTIQGDRVRIGEVFRNLITNAMKYNDKPEKWIEIGYGTDLGLEFQQAKRGRTAVGHAHRVLRARQRHRHPREAPRGHLPHLQAPARPRRVRRRHRRRPDDRQEDHRAPRRADLGRVRHAAKGPASISPSPERSNHGIATPHAARRGQPRGPRGHHPRLQEGRAWPTRSTAASNGDDALDYLFQRGKYADAALAPARTSSCWTSTCPAPTAARSWPRSSSRTT